MTWRLSWWLRLIASWAAVAPLPLTAAAQPDQGEARARFESGEAAYARGDYEAALSDFEQAYRLSNEPELLFNIGISAARTRHRERAVEAFQAYLRELPNVLNRGDVEARIEDISELIAAENRERVGAREDRGAREDHGPREDATPPPADDGGGGGPNLLPIIGLGASGALAIGGVILLVLSQVDKSTVESATDGTMWADISGAYDRIPVLSGIGFALLGLGVAGAAVFTVLVVTSGGSAEEAPATAALSLGPGSLMVRGSW